MLIELEWCWIDYWLLAVETEFGYGQSNVSPWALLSASEFSSWTHFPWLLLNSLAAEAAMGQALSFLKLLCLGWWKTQGIKSGEKLEAWGLRLEIWGGRGGAKGIEELKRSLEGKLNSKEEKNREKGKIGCEGRQKKMWGPGFRASNVWRWVGNNFYQSWGAVGSLKNGDPSELVIFLDPVTDLWLVVGTWACKWAGLVQASLRTIFRQ